MTLIPATRLSPTYTALDAFGDFLQPGRTLPSPAAVERARVLAEQLEALRARTGARRLRVVRWADGDGAPHPAGDAHADGGAVDILPNGVSAVTLARFAHQLGFYRVIELGNDRVHVEIGEGPAEPLTRVARSALPAKVLAPSIGVVGPRSPLVTLGVHYPADMLRVLVAGMGLDALVPERRAAHLVRILDITQPYGELDEDLSALAVGLGIRDDGDYYAYGPRWHTREIAAGVRVDPVRGTNETPGFFSAAQWGRVGPWQVLRSSAITDGLAMGTPWTTRQQLREASVIDPETGKPAGDMVGTVEGLLADDLKISAVFAARALGRLGSLEAYLHEMGIEAPPVLAAAAAARPLLRRYREVRAQGAEVSSGR